MAEQPAAGTADAEHSRWMEHALQQARTAAARREVPVGCVFVRDGVIVGRGGNETNATRNATRHAELVAIDGMIADAGGDCAQLRLHECTLYVTVEPCIMCAGALSILGLKHAVYGCRNDKFGGCGSILSVSDAGCGGCGGAASPGFPTTGGVRAQEAVELLRSFYATGNPAAPKPHRPVVSADGAPALHPS
ncbi:unnamed protein product [Pedinophyceae sp. YPF-701]|nr:unnamed protein product [Pedinophyceae sp. YPF-701]